MATCTDCGGRIVLATIEGKRIPLDQHTSMLGTNRYVRRVNGNWAKVADRASVRAQQVHADSCPAKHGHR